MLRSAAALTARLLHNPGCSKSRAALQLLTDAGADFEVREYLQDPLSAAEVLELVAKLDAPARELTRGEAPAGGGAEAVAAAVAADPALMQRPIFEVDSAAVIGRPPAAVLELLEP